VRDEHPCDSAGDCCFEILGEATTTAEPRKSPLDHPAARQDLEALGSVRTLDDFQRPRALAFQCGAEFGSGITAVSEDMPQLRIERADRCENARRAVAILNVGFMHDEADEVALRVGDDMPQRPLIFLPASNPRGPPLSVVFTDGLSMTPAVGLASRPAFSRAAMTKA